MRAISAEAAEIPVKPNRAATSDTTSMTSAHFKIVDMSSILLPTDLRIQSARNSRVPPRVRQTRASGTSLFFVLAEVPMRGNNWGHKPTKIGRRHHGFQQTQRPDHWRRGDRDGRGTARICSADRSRRGYALL